MKEITVKNLMESMSDFFVAERASGLAAIVQFELSGQGGGNWTVNIHDEKCEIEVGKAKEADLMFQASAQDVLDIFNNQLDPMQAYMQGRLRLKGNIGLAMRLFGLFEVDYEKLNKMRGA
jgi:putative sterol carrier protein